MKKATMTLGLIALTMGWISCKKKDSPAPIDTTIYPSGMHALVNGAAWTNATIDNTSITGGGHYTFVFGGTDTTHIQLAIEIADATGTGVHKLGANSADKAYFLMDTGANPVIYATSGEISINVINDSVAKGTFQFTAGSNTVTGGTFNMKF